MNDDSIKNVGRVIVTGERIEMPDLGLSFPIVGGGIHGDPGSDSDSPIEDNEEFLAQSLRDHVERIQHLESNENFKQLSKDIREKLYQNVRITKVITDFYGKNGVLVVDGTATATFINYDGKLEIQFGSRGTMESSAQDADFPRALLTILHEFVHFEYSNSSVSPHSVGKAEAYTILNSATLLNELGLTLESTGALFNSSTNYRNGYKAAQQYIDGQRSEQSVLDEIEQYDWS